MSLSRVTGKVGSQRTNVVASEKVSGHGMSRMKTFCPSANMLGLFGVVQNMSQAEGCHLTTKCSFDEFYSTVKH